MKKPLVLEGAETVAEIMPNAFLPKSICSMLARTDLLFQEERLVRGYSAYRHAISKEIRDIKPDLIVADWIGPLVALPKAADIPVVYIMHDFAHKIENLKRIIGKKSKSARGTADIDLLRNIELSVVKKANAIISASCTEARELEVETGRPVGYIPIFGNGQAPKLSEFTEKPKVFLLGFTNTAMKSSLQTLAKVLRASPDTNNQIELHHIGSVPSEKPAEWRQLEELMSIKYHGYVENLDEMFSFGDVLLTPFTGGTGFRTKIVTAAAHGVLNVGIKGSFACASEFVSGVNCIMAENEDDLIFEIKKILTDSSSRRKLSLASRSTFEENFNMDRRIDDYKAALSPVI